jgi:lipopolysaccharide/colanic/teichoic acid biosynthesis glycosyltransferase
VTLLLALALRMTRKGPAFVMSSCIGLHGIPFCLYSFRCSPADNGWVNRFLLRFKLHLLPSALNLIRGEIALIGPRPERAEFDHVLSAMIPFYRQKQSVKPGIFGWSQLHCNREPEEDSLRRLEYDLYYIKHLSISLDLYIMLRGLKRVLSGRPEPTQA